MSEKNKNGDYEKPLSHQLGGDDLEDVAGGTAPECSPGQAAEQGCSAGQHPVASGCMEGNIAKPHSCATGGIAGSSCNQGRIVN
jgi:hypothetical protein